MMVTIVTTSPAFGTAPAVARRLQELGWTLRRCLDAAALEAAVEEADALVVGLIGPTPEVLARGRRLRAVVKHGVGVDNIDIAACAARGLPVTNAPGANADAVAELALGLMFAMARAIPRSHNAVVAGGWQREVGSQLGGKVLGILGLGNIGRRVAVLGQGVGMQVIAHDPFADAGFARARGITLCPLEAVLAQADYLSLHVFGGAGNAALLDAARLQRMKRGARLLNLARGEVVDLDALHAALASGHLAGVALDAYAQEPPDVGHPIFAHPAAVFMPHSGADTLEALEAVGLMNIADIAAILAGGAPDPGRLCKVPLALC